MDDYLKLAEIRDIIEKGSNLDNSYGLYVDPRTQVRTAWSDSDNGWVDPKNPTIVNLARLRPTTLGHEAAHVQQNLASLFDIEQPQNRHSEAGYGQQGREGLNQVINQLRTKFPKFVGANVGDSSREILANLQGIEAGMPAGTNILDKLDLPPAYRRLLEHRMFPTQNKFFNSEYVPKEPSLQNNESIAQYIKRKYFK